MIKVSIIMITYNHEDFIEEAIEGVLMQKCNFDFELIIADDASKDNNQNIIKELKNNNPNIVKPILRKTNIGMQPNFIDAFHKCKGKYIALCEGDDYWTDPLKLQKQVDFLEGNEEYGICFHNVEELNTLGKTKTGIIPNVKKNTDFTINDYIASNHTATCSMVFKAEMFMPIPNWFAIVPFGDLGLVLNVLKNSNKKARVLKETMGVYRIHEGGIHGSFHKNNKTLIKAYQQHIIFFNIIKKELLVEKEYQKAIAKKFEKTYNQLGKLSEKENKIFSQISYNLKSSYFKLLRKYI